MPDLEKVFNVSRILKTAYVNNEKFDRTLRQI